MRLLTAPAPQCLHTQCPSTAPALRRSPLHARHPLFPSFTAVSVDGTPCRSISRFKSPLASQVCDSFSHFYVGAQYMRVATTPSRTASFYSPRPSMSSNDVHRSTRGDIWWCRLCFPTGYKHNRLLPQEPHHNTLPSQVSKRGPKTRRVRRRRLNTGAFRCALTLNTRRRGSLSPSHQRSPPPYLCSSRPTPPSKR